MVACPSCGQENPDGFRFCGACGSPLTPEPRLAREERKVVTVLFCDLVGSTAQAERMDPEDVRALLQRYHEQVRRDLERFGGTVEKFIGDAVMALFGAPVAHEDDPERAVRAALAIREWAQEEGELQVRIGITTGEALVALTAHPQAGEGMASGDVVNTAARLQSAAPENGILVDETTYRASERAIEYGAESHVAAKGKVEPVRVWRAVEANARFGVDVRQIGSTPLVGRARELQVLADALTRVKEEREPQLVTVVGVPGIGKSRLVWELFRLIEAGPDLVAWRQGRSLPYGEGVAFWALGEMVKAHAGILETDPPREVERKLEAVADDQWFQSHLRPLVGLEAHAALGGDRRTEAFAAWRSFFERLAEHRPLVLVFEDLHWADDGLLDFVDYLADWVSGVPLLVVGTARPELIARRPNWGGGKPRATTLSLSPLSESEIAQLVAELPESSVLPAELQSSLLARAGGNPLYAEEFIRLMRDRPGDAAVPESVHGIIAARLDSLAAEEKELVQDAAVLGKVFWLGGLVDGRTRWGVEELLHSLERKEFVRRERRTSVAGETEFAFRHALVRDVAYEQIPRALRAEKHVAVARWIESLGRPGDHAEMLAHHYLSALALDRATRRVDDSVVERARVVCRDAGDRAHRLNAFPSAARFYSHALELASDDEERADLLLRLGSALHRTADVKAEEILRDAAHELVATRRRERAAEAHVLLSELWWDRGKRDLSYQELEIARELLGAEESEAKARVLSRLARVQGISGEHREAIRIGREALALADRMALDDVRSHALNTLGVARFQLGDSAGLADLERSIEISSSTGSHLIANAYNNLGFQYTMSGDVRRDRALRADALRWSERFGDERMRRFVRLCMPMLDLYAGEWDRARRDADEFVAEFETGSPHYLEANVRWTRALLHLALANDEIAAADAERAVEVARDAKDPQMILPALGVHLWVNFELGTTEAVEADARELLAMSATHAARPPAVDLAWVAETLGLSDDVRRWINGIAYPSRWSDAAFALLDGDFAAAADVFAHIGSLPDEAYARLTAARELFAAEKQTQAHDQLERALHFYRTVGATRYIREAEALREASAAATGA